MKRSERYGLHPPLPGRAITLGLAVGIALVLSNPPAIARVRAPSGAPAREYLGLRLGMAREAAHERLEHIGRAAARKGEESESETWTLSDRRFGFAAVGYDDQGRLSWFSLFGRPGGQPVLMRSLADLARAEQKGTYIYVWSLPALAGQPACKVIARSQDPDTLRSLSVASVGEDGRERAAPADSAR